MSERSLYDMSEEQYIQAVKSLDIYTLKFLMVFLEDEERKTIKELINTKVDTDVFRAQGKALQNASLKSFILRSLESKNNKNT